MNWHAMALLGAYHGINPGMGWLFAVALALQQGSGRGVWRAVTPIALGHAAAIGGVVAAATLAGLVVPVDALKVGVASILITFGLYRLWRHGHLRYGGMRVGFRDLTVWSFLMASAHGAGFMVLPFVMPGPATLVAAGHDHANHIAAAHTTAVATTGVMAVAVHSGAYLAMMSLVAWVVYRRIGLSVLRTAWLNVDWIWAGALVITGVVVLLS
jgi:hypothetical protein